MAIIVILDSELIRYNPLVWIYRFQVGRFELETPHTLFSGRFGFSSEVFVVSGMQRFPVEK